MDGFRKKTSILLAKKKYGEVIEACSNELKINIHNAYAYFFLGTASYELHARKEALDFFKIALEYNSSDVDFLRGVAGALEKLSRRQESVELYDAVCNKTQSEADWRMCAYTASLAIPDPLESIRRIHQWANKFYPSVEFDYKKFRYISDVSERKLKVGFLSGDLRNHAVGFVFRNLYSHFSNIRKYVYLTLPPDSVTNFYKERTDGWRDVRHLEDKALKKLILSDKLDVLIDLAGMTNGNRIKVLSSRVAPIQVSWWGYMPTMGISTYDYKFSDEIFFKDNQEFYSEKFLNINTMVTYSPPEYAPLNLIPPAERGEVTYLSLNNSAKINEKTFSLWMRILAMNSNSRLIVMTDFENDENGVRHIKAFVKDLAPELIDRVQIITRLPLNQYMELGYIADVCLDAFPQSGGVTTLHAAWMGMPTITIKNTYVLAGYSAGIMKKLGFEEYCANDEEDFVKIASDLGCNIEKLSYFRENVRERFESSGLLDYKAQAESIEKVLRQKCEELAHEASTI